MRKILKVTKRANSPLIKEIQKFESDNGFILPNEYKDFLIEDNPIYVEESRVIYDNGEAFLDRFYPFDINQELSLQSTYLNLNDYFQNKYIPIGCDPGDWQFVLSLAGDSTGSIYLCRMDTDIPDSLTYIANSFEEFVNKLQ